ncbi:MAG: hypothetical protein J4N81_08395, partial [Chloroflexi bacterium]|nr:hypothetical protein [Chloroflexota bacterium]
PAPAARAATPTPTRTPFATPTETPVPKPTPTPVAMPTRTPFPTPTPTPTPSPATPVRASDIVNFNLESFTVSVGTKVTWTNKDAAQHTSTSGVSDNKDGIWDSPILRQNEMYSFTFNQPGSFPYWCTVHPFMVGTVTVEP